VRSVERLASALIAVRFTPDIVITHSEHDRHRDHRAVAQIVRAVTGNGPLGLGMAVVNSVEDTFAPELFVETSRYVAAKAEALRAHRSQDERGRIRPAAIREFERGHAAVHGVEQVEPFELLRPLSADDAGVLSYLGPCVIRDAAR
jgi:LmbE family N-acetylglucosaminyl deacetylase